MYLEGISLIIYCVVLISWVVGSPKRANSALWGGEDIWWRTQGLVIHYLTLFVVLVYNYMIPRPLHCKIKEEPTQQKRNFTKYPFK